MPDLTIQEYDNMGDSQKDRFLTFPVDDATNGIEMHYIKEIVGLQAITEIPTMPGYIKGILNLRGFIISVMDVRLRFGKDQRDYDDRTCVVIIEISGSSMGLIVDRVYEVLSIPVEDITVIPDVRYTTANRFMKNIGKSSGNVVLIVDCENLLKENKTEVRL